MHTRGTSLSHLQRTATDLFKFDGRSSRTEFLVVWALMAIMAMTIIVNLVLTGSSRMPYGHYLQPALWVLAIPLFARRLHDQNRSGWIALIIPAMLVLNAYGQAQFGSGNLLIPSLAFPYNGLKLIVLIAFWVLVFWPGTKGENRFGTDPRQDDGLVVR